MLKKIIEYLSLLTLLIFAIQFSYLEGYFSMFRIRILNYMDYSEILIANASWLIFIVTFIPLLLLLFVDFKSSNNEHPLTLLRDNSKIIIRLIYFIVFTLLFIQIYEMYLKHTSNYITAKPFFYFVKFLLLSLSLVLSYMRSKSFTSVQNPFAIILVLIVSIICLSSSLLGKGTALTILDKNIQTSNIVFKYNSHVITSSDSLIFLGETKSTIFMYDRKKTRTFIYPKNNIDSLSLHI